MASTAADAAAVAAIEAHHAELAGGLALRERALTDAARAGGPADEEARADLVGWAETELLPHAVAEEKTLYAAARERPELRALVDAMLAEHRLLAGLVAELRDATEPVVAAAAGRALQVLFDSHLAKENDQLLPVLAAAADVSVAHLLGGMHELVGGSHQATSDGPGDQHGHQHGHQHGDQHGHQHGQCGCSEADAAGDPELDARAVPHAIRHATIFGALDAVPPGHGLVLVAPHDPVPLLAQVEERAPGAFAVSYLERGPEAWRLRFVRRG
jgi:uncharacterized protein (DUF2249 family)